MKRVLFILFILFAVFYVKAQNRNFFEENWQEKTFSVPVNYTENNFNTVQADATVNVYLKDSIAKILPTISGVNTTFRSGADMLDRIPLYEKSGWGAYRFPAGSGSNTYFWDGNIPDSIALDTNLIDGTKNYNLKPVDFADFIKSTGAQATIVVNYFYARYGITNEGTRSARVQQAADYAAGFVRKMNIDLGANIKYWEIGNECYGKWEHGWVINGDTITGTEYAEDFAVFAAAMKAVDPDIKVGAVVWGKENIWNEQVIAGVKDVADFLVVHEYFTGFSPTKEELLASITEIKADIDMLNDLTETAAGKPRGYFPIAMTEYNTRGKYTTTMLNALFTAEIIGEQIKNGYGLAERWVGEWGWSPETHGVIAKADDPYQDAYTPRQAYMAYRYYNLYFGDYLINVSSSYDSIKVYASRFSDGKIALCIINQSEKEQNLKISFNDLPDNMQLTNAYWYEIYANDINYGNQKFYINGETSTTAGGGPVEFENVLPYKSVLNDNSVFTAKKYSMNFIVFDYNELTTSIDHSLQNENIIIYPNPVKDDFIIKTKEKIKKAEIYNMQGELIYTIKKPEQSVNVAFLDKGQYLVVIVTEKDKLIRQIIKI